MSKDDNETNCGTNTVPVHGLVSWNADGSVTLSAAAVDNLAETLNEWEAVGYWTKHDDCKGWKEDIDARENRRECIVYQNCKAAIKGLFGNRDMRERMEKVHSS